jgi:4-hydroxy-3-methylbut-2-enyl diphosphate reductase
MSIDGFRKLRNELETKSGKPVETHDTICRQVANRVPHLQEFAAHHEVIVFVGGRESSNAHVLFDVCKSVNENTYFVSHPEELDISWFQDVQTVGICGATSTPQWLMNEIAEKIGQS